MSTSGFGELRRALEVLLELEAPARARALAEHAVRDPLLHADLEALLVESEQLSGFLEPTPAAASFPSDAPAQDAGLPAPLVSPPGYRLLRLVGVGGMASVWEAEQDHPRRRVAIKLLHTGSDDSAQRRRLRREVRILAELRHPHIATVLAAGDGEEERSTETSVAPWIALEFVDDARTIVDHGRARALPLAERLQLFLPVLAAVRYGHERGIIHRDLKPANVLVGGDGVPKVIDFGIARLAGKGLPPTWVTESGKQLGTLPYMAPERIEGRCDGGTVQSDVYSLGVLLHELCAERELEPPDRDALERALDRLRHGEPERLPFVGVPRASDLRAVIGKAMARRPEERYGSVGEFAWDLEAWLAAEPVRARPASPWRQGHALLRRYPVLFGAFWFGLPLLTLAAAVSLVFAWHARAEAERAASALARAERSNYAANIAAAQAALRAFDGASARGRLNSCAPELRDFEWWALRMAADRSELRTRVEGGVPYDLEFAPCGTWYAVATVDGGIEWRGAERGELLARFEGDGRVGTLVAVTPDREYVVQGLRDGQLRVFSEPGRLASTLSTGSDTILALALDPRTTRVATGHPGGWRLWDWHSGERLGGAEVNGIVAALAFCPRGERLAVCAGSPAAVTVIDPENSSEHLRILLEGIRSFADLDFSPDGEWLAIASHDGLVRLLDLERGQVMHVLRGHEGIVERARFSGDGQFLFSAGWDRTLRRWHVETGLAAGVILGHEAHVLALAVAPSGDRLVSADRSGHLRHWQGAGRWQDRLPVRRRWDWGLRFDLDSGQLLMLNGGTARRVRGPDDGEGTALPTDVRVFAGAFGPSGSVAVGTERGGIQVFGPADIPGVRFGVGEARIDALLYCATREAWIALDRDGLLAEYGNHGAYRGAIANDTTAVERSADGTLFFVRRGRGLFRLDVDAAQSARLLDRLEPNRLRVDSGGKKIAAAYRTGSVVIFDAHTGVRELSLAGHEGDVLDLAFKPAGSRLASAGADGSVRLWDLNSGAEVAAFVEHSDAVYALDFHPDGSWLVSGSLDGTIAWRHGGTDDERRRWYRSRSGLHEALLGEAGPEFEFDEALAFARDVLFELRFHEQSEKRLKRSAAVATWALEVVPEAPLTRFAQAFAAVRAGVARDPRAAVQPQDAKPWPERFAALAILEAAVRGTEPGSDAIGRDGGGDGGDGGGDGAGRIAGAERPDALTAALLREARESSRRAGEQ